jgi:hypothetical protein
LPCDELAGRVADLERSSTATCLLGWVTAGALILLLIALRRKGILTGDLLGEAFPRA